MNLRLDVDREKLGLIVSHLRVPEREEKGETVDLHHNHILSRIFLKTQKMIVKSPKFTIRLLHSPLPYKHRTRPFQQISSIYSILINFTVVSGTEYLYG